MECCGRTLENARHVETGVAGRVAGAGEHWPDSCGQKGVGGSSGALLQRGVVSSSESALALRRLRDGGGGGVAVGAGGCRAGKFEHLEQLALLAATAQMLLLED